jgi:hypothetical protein
MPEDRTTESNQPEAGFGPSGRSLSHQLMVGLFYPAVLGAVFYTFLPFLEEHALVWEKPVAFLAAIGIFLHFCVDWTHTARARDYSWRTFLLDAGILLCLYSAFRSVHFFDGSPDYHAIAISLAATYWLYLLWDLMLRRAEPLFQLLVTFQALSLAFLGLAGLWDFPPTVLVGAILVMAALQMELMRRSLLS